MAYWENGEEKSDLYPSGSVDARDFYEREYLRLSEIPINNGRMPLLPGKPVGVEPIAPPDLKPGSGIRW